MESIWESKTYPKNAARLFNFWYILKEVKIFYSGDKGSVGQRAEKLLSIKLWEWFKPGPHMLAHTSIVMAEVTDNFFQLNN